MKRLLLLIALTSSCATLFPPPKTGDSGLPGWPTAASYEPRHHHTATLLEDGRLLVLGGYPTGTRAEIYDPAADTWTRVREMPAKYDQHTATLLEDGRVFVYGGGLTSMAKSHAAIYNPEFDTWIGGVIQEGVQGRTSHTAELLPDGRVLLLGGNHKGWSSLHHTDRAKLFDPSYRPSAHNNSYEVPLQQPIYSQCVARSNHASTVLQDGSVFVVGGQLSSTIHEETERFDPAANDFHRLAPMEFERSRTTATTLPDGRVLVVGGWGRRAEGEPFVGRCVKQVQENEPGIVVTIPVPTPPTPQAIPATPYFLGSVELYDPTTDTWKAAASMRHPRADHVATLLKDGRVLVTGGIDEAGVMAFAEVYDPRTDAWTELPSLAMKRAGHTVTVLPDGKVAVIGGGDLSERWAVGTLELWDPTK